MFLPKRLFEQEKEPEVPTPPTIDNLEAVAAQNELNSLLKREDISINAVPSNEEKVLTVFTHGYGSSKWVWIDPYFGSHGWLRDHRNDPLLRSYGWHSKPPPSHMYSPFSISVSPLVFPEGVFNTLKRNGQEVLAYSQRDPFGDIDISAKELEILLNGVKKIYGERKIILVGHSRGGICLRRYLDLNTNPDIKKVITLATPHLGSNFMNFRVIKQPIIKILNDTNFKRFWDITGTRKAHDINHEQLATNSKYLFDLKDREKSPEIEYIVTGGTCPTFANFYTWSMVKRKVSKEIVNRIFHRESKIVKKKKVTEVKKEETKNYQWVAYPNKFLSLFEKRVIPELNNGDGVISLRSALLSTAIRKYKFNKNHEEIAICGQTKKLLLKEIKLTQKET